MTDKCYVQIKAFGTAVLAGIAWVLTYADIDKDIFFIYSIFITLDLITGIYKSYRLGYNISSYKLVERTSAKIVTLLIPVLVGVGTKIMEGDFHFFYTYVMNILIAAEIYSIIGNAYSGATKKDIPEWDAVTDVITFIRKVLFRNR